METVITIISALVGLATLLTLLVSLGKFIQRVNEHDKKLDAQAAKAEEYVKSMDKQSEKIAEQGRNIEKQGEKIAEQGRNIEKQGEKITEQGRNIDKLVHLVENHDFRIVCLQNDMSEVKRDLSDLKKDVTDLRMSMASISGALSSNLKNIIPSAGKCSPRALNDYGKKLFKDMNGASFLEKNKDELFAFIDRMHLKTAYDVEIEAKKALIANSSSDMFIEIKSFLYNYPEFEVNGMMHEVSMFEACSILYIPLRDMYLDAHPEIIR